MNFIGNNNQGGMFGMGGIGGFFGGIMNGVGSLLSMVLELLMGILMGGMLGQLMGGNHGQGGGGFSPGAYPGFGDAGGGGGSPAGGFGSAANNFLGGSTGAGGGGGGGGAPIPTGPVAPGVEGMLAKANSMVGLNENRDTAAIQSVTGKSGINPATTPWCAAFAMNMLKDHGVLDTSGLSNPNYCPTIKSWANGKGIWGGNGQYTPKAGDAILFDWEKDGTSDHIGIVEKVENGKVYTIEGNSSDSVKKNVYDLGSSKIDGYVITGKK